MPKILTPEEREASKQARREYLRAWEQAHKTERRAARKQWRKDHPDREAAAKARYYAKLVERMKDGTNDD